MKTAFLFPGQGAQYVGMGASLAASLPEAKVLFDQASTVLGYDLLAVCTNGPVERLNASLSAAVQAQDLAAARPAAIAILAFVDQERDWLRDNPPADCYAAAHASAGAMLDAYGTAADGFIKWADSGGGLAGLATLGDAVDLAQTAADASGSAS